MILEDLKDRKKSSKNLFLDKFSQKSRVILLANYSKIILNFVILYFFRFSLKTTKRWKVNARCSNLESRFRTNVINGTRIVYHNEA